jgi:sodium pump decarboxylase gamma subunit
MAGDKITLSLTILLTGFAVVFAVLLLLIGLIKLYGTVIYNIQNKDKQKKTKVVVTREELADIAPIAPTVEQPVPDDEDDAVIAVIAAAITAMYEPGSVRIKSVRKAQPRSSAWRTAGLMDNVRPF